MQPFLGSPLFVVLPLRFNIGLKTAMSKGGKLLMLKIQATQSVYLGSSPESSAVQVQTQTGDLNLSVSRIPHLQNRSNNMTNPPLHSKFSLKTELSEIHRACFYEINEMRTRADTRRVPETGLLLLGLITTLGHWVHVLSVAHVQNTIKSVQLFSEHLGSCSQLVELTASQRSRITFYHQSPGHLLCPQAWLHEID